MNTPKQENKCSVYLVTCIISKKSYVGVTVYGLKKRWGGHLKSVRNGSKYKFHNAIRKYGANNFEYQLLKKCISPAEAFREEIRYIAKLKTFGKFGYNMTPGGEGVHGIAAYFWGLAAGYLAGVITFTLLAVLMSCLTRGGK